MSPDALNQFPAAPVPTLSGFPVTLPAAVSQPTGMPSGPAGSMPLTLGQPVMGINLVGPVGGAAAQTSSGFIQKLSNCGQLCPSYITFNISHLFL